ncbi:unnamed protein product [Lepeophtheirus salmonis]|uniref:(salmon louse) hypothetical protein n=1 Tax=Lepeophtheirus salmonis TaxID=72036 RepID=A0A7R8H5T4_LEPSM|nr:unnamed protein product [Lepeophtheirus salmonis]CAF2873297.1 unnamed protein product [Lepeophtheirus salmonis]
MHIPSLSDSQNHWIDTSHFGENRVVFDTSPNPRKAKLKIFNVTESDDGLYRCRVDFKISQTRTSRLNLTVIVVEDNLRILEGLTIKKEELPGSKKLIKVIWPDPRSRCPGVLNVYQYIYEGNQRGIRYRFLLALK